MTTFLNKKLLVLPFLLLGFISFSQDESDVIEVQPQFEGGISAMYGFLAKHIQYPKVCREEEISGKVYIQFVINKKGKVTKIKVLRSPHDALSKEAIRVIKKMPKWKPGETKDGKKAKVKFTLPINFTYDIEEENNKKE